MRWSYLHNHASVKALHVLLTVTRIKFFKRTLSQNVFRACDCEVKLEIQYINRLTDRLKRMGQFMGVTKQTNAVTSNGVTRKRVMG